MKRKLNDDVAGLSKDPVATQCDNSQVLEQERLAKHTADVFFQIVGNQAIKLSTVELQTLRHRVKYLSERVQYFESFVPSCCWYSGTGDTCEECRSTMSCFHAISPLDCNNHVEQDKCSECHDVFCIFCLHTCDNDNYLYCPTCLSEHALECTACRPLL